MIFSGKSCHTEALKYSENRNVSYFAKGKWDAYGNILDLDNYHLMVKIIDGTVYSVRQLNPLIPTEDSSLEVHYED